VGVVEVWLEFDSEVPGVLHMLPFSPILYIVYRSTEYPNDARKVNTKYKYVQPRTIDEKGVAYIFTGTMLCSKCNGVES